jgi:hypothetical protein
MSTHDELHPHDTATGRFVESVPTTEGRIDDFDAPDTETSEANAIVAEIVANTNAWEYDLIYVAYDDQLTEAQMNDYLAGDFQAVEESVDDAFLEHRYERLDELAQEACDKHDVDFNFLSDEDQERIKEAIAEKDSSDPVADLARNTHAQLMRAPLAADIYHLLTEDEKNTLAYPSNDGYEEQQAGRATVLARILEQSDVDVADPTVKEAIDDLVQNGPDTWHEGVSLDVIWYGDVKDAAAASWSNNLPVAVDGRNLHFTGARIVLLDSWNGSGMDVELPGALNVRVTPEQPAVLDSSPATNGYGWDDVAGVSKDAYRPAKMWTSWQATEPEPEAAAA